MVNVPQHWPLQLLGVLISVVVALGALAETHSKVQAALDWQLPANDCRKPRPVGNSDDVLAHGGSVSHGLTNTTENSSGTPTVFGVDHYKLGRYERKKKRWETCVSDYKADLMADFGTLKNSAQYGLTQQQAEAILGKLALIQTVVESPEGRSNAIPTQ